MIISIFKKCFNKQCQLKIKNKIKKKIISHFVRLHLLPAGGHTQAGQVRAGDAALHGDGARAERGLPLRRRKINFLRK